MSEPGIWVAIGVVFWLGVATIAASFITGELGWVSARIVPSGSLALDEDGPDLGARLPEEVAAILPRLAQSEHYIFLLTPTCSPCREVAGELMTLGERPDLPDLTVLLPGPFNLVEDFASLLPSSVRVVFDPQAGQLAASLELSTAPFVIIVREGVVSGKMYVDSVNRLLAFDRELDKVGPGADSSDK